MSNLIHMTRIQTTTDRKPLRAAVPVHMITTIREEQTSVRVSAARGQAIDQIDVTDAYDSVCEQYERQSEDLLSKFLMLTKDLGTVDGREVIFRDLIERTVQQVMEDMAARADAIDSQGTKKRK